MKIIATECSSHLITFRDQRDVSRCASSCAVTGISIIEGSSRRALFAAKDQSHVFRAATLSSAACVALLANQKTPTAQAPAKRGTIFSHCTAD